MRINYLQAGVAANARVAKRDNERLILVGQMEKRECTGAVLYRLEYR